MKTIKILNYCLILLCTITNLYSQIGSDTYEFLKSKYKRVSWNSQDERYTVRTANYGDTNAFMGIFDINGKEIIAPTKYTYVAQCYEGFYVRIGDKVGWCDNNGKEIIAPTKYTYVSKYDKGFDVKIGDKKGWCDINGKEILDAIYEGIGFPSEDLIAAKKEGKWGYVSAVDGSVVIPFEYDEASTFQDDVARVKKNGKSELISNPLKVVAQNDKPKVKGKAVSTYPAPNSDVDNNIPIGKKADDNTFAFIIANENYPMAKVPYALNDGWIFEQYCKKTLGLKDDNVRIYEDATGGNIHACIEQIKQIATAYDGDANIIFYYAGHAFPDEDKNTAYLLPIDGDSKNINTGYSLEKLYKELNSVKTKSVVCFIDACFSGATREDEMLLAGRGVAIKVKDDVPLGNIVVFTSATGAETAHQYEEKGHGLFTYYLLQKLQETKGNVTLGDLSEHVRKMVRRKSVLINQKMQTPTVIPSQALQDKWQKIKL